MKALEFFHAVDSFIFEYQITNEHAAIMRFVFCMTIMSFFLWTLRDSWEFMQPKGIFSSEDYLKLCRTRFPQISLFNIWPNSTLLPYIVFFGMFFFGLLSAFGVYTSISLWLFLIFLISYQSRTFVILMSGSDSISRIMIASLILMDCGRTYSIDSLFTLKPTSSMVIAPGVRLLQIAISLIYTQSAIEKLRCKFWLEGKSLRNAIYSVMWGRRLGMNVVKIPWIYKPAAIFTVVFQYFAVLGLWLTDIRPFFLLIAFFLHISILVFLKIGPFGPVMAAALFSFLDFVDFKALLGI